MFLSRKYALFQDTGHFSNVTYVFCTMKTITLSNPHVKLSSGAHSAICQHIWMLRCSMKQYSQEDSIKAPELKVLCLNIVF